MQAYTNYKNKKRLEAAKAQIHATDINTLRYFTSCQGMPLINWSTFIEDNSAQFHFKLSVSLDSVVYRYTGFYSQIPRVTYSIQGIAGNGATDARLLLRLSGGREVKQHLLYNPNFLSIYHLHH